MHRPYGSGQIYEKWGSYYGRWRSPDGRRLNRVLGHKRVPGSSEGLTRSQAERALRRVQAEQAQMVVRDVTVERLTVDDVLDRVRDRLAFEGARLSYLQNCESMQRIHISPAIGSTRIDASVASMSSSSPGQCSRPALPRRQLGTR